MGRARGGDSKTMTAFSAVLPGRRGAYRETDLDSPYPGKEAYLYVERLLRRDFHEAPLYGVSLMNWKR